MDLFPNDACPKSRYICCAFDFFLSIVEEDVVDEETIDVQSSSLCVEEYFGSGGVCGEGEVVDGDGGVFGDLGGALGVGGVCGSLESCLLFANE